MYWDISSLRIPLLAAGLFFIPTVLRGIMPPLGNFFAIAALLWMVLTTVASLLAGCAGDNENLNPAYIYVFMIAMLLTIPLLTTRERVLGMLFTTSVSLTILTAKTGIYAGITGGSLYDVDIGSGSFSGTNPAALGTAVAIYFMLFVFQMLRDEESTARFHWIFQHKLFLMGLTWFMLLLIIGSVYFVVGTQSRGSAFGMIAGGLLWILLHPRRMATIAVGATLASILLLFVTIPDEYTDRLASAFASSEDLDHSAASRPHFWNTARDMTKDHFYGVGVGCYGYYYNIYDKSEGQYGRSRSVHSSHFGVLAELGYMGFCLWIFLFLKTYFNFWKIRQHARDSRTTSVKARFFFNLSNAMIAAQTTFIIGGTFYEMSYNYFIWLIFVITVVADRLYWGVKKPHVRELTGNGFADPLPKPVDWIKTILKQPK